VHRAEAEAAAGVAKARRAAGGLARALDLGRLPSPRPAPLLGVGGALGQARGGLGLFGQGVTGRARPAGERAAEALLEHARVAAGRAALEVGLGLALLGQPGGKATLGWVVDDRFRWRLLFR
jgi:hypothetical protein